MVFKSIFDNRDWAIHHQVEGWTLHSLDIEQIKAVLATVPDKRKHEIRVWKRKWSRWNDLKHPDCRPVLEPRKESKEAPALTPNLIENEMNGGQDKMVVPLSKERAFMNRKHQRHDIKLAATVILGSSQFRTFTRDLSLGGVCLADPLPDWVAGYCTVVLETPDSLEIELVCTLVEDQKQDKFRLEIVRSLKYEELQEWMSRHNFP